jgi:hypothetical protein
LSAGAGNGLARHLDDVEDDDDNDVHTGIDFINPYFGRKQFFLTS